MNRVNGGYKFWLGEEVRKSRVPSRSCSRKPSSPFWCCLVPRPFPSEFPCGGGGSVPAGLCLVEMLPCVKDKHMAGSLLAPRVRAVGTCSSPLTGQRSLGPSNAMPVGQRDSRQHEAIYTPSSNPLPTAPGPLQVTGGVRVSELPAWPGFKSALLQNSGTGQEAARPRGN